IIRGVCPMVLALTRWFAGLSRRKPIRRAPRGNWTVNRLEYLAVPAANIAFALSGQVAGAPPQGHVYNTSGAQVASITPFNDFFGDLNVAVGDVNGDGTLDVIVAPGNGGGPLVR